MKMELKDALELVQSDWEHHADAKYREAARLLREGSEKVEHRVKQSFWTCPKCNRFGGDCSCRPLVHHTHWDLKDYTKTYTTHNELKIIEVTSESRFVEIGEVSNAKNDLFDMGK